MWPRGPLTTTASTSPLRMASRVSFVSRKLSASRATSMAVCFLGTVAVGKFFLRTGGAVAVRVGLDLRTMAVRDDCEDFFMPYTLIQWVLLESAESRVFRSRPMMILSRSDKFPIKRFGGLGCFLTRVGAA